MTTALSAGTLAVAVATALAAALSGCAGAMPQGEQMTNASPTGAGATATSPATSAAARQGRLTARPESPTEEGQPGSHRLDVRGGRDALLAVPAGYRPGTRMPLALMLHGAGGTAEHGLGLLGTFADERGVIVPSVPSQRQTWDVIMGGFGTDVAAIDEALGIVFERYAVDPTRLAVAGFSDGASYALSLGITNGALFSHIVAFSPGFAAPGPEEGEPKVYVSHGTRDQVLPIERCSRQLVPVLRQAGYEVMYREFDGPHTVPTAIVQEAMGWFLGA